ncbi:MAG: S8 family serine peptidase [Akkermansiaceae bacterium]
MNVRIFLIFALNGMVAEFSLSQNISTTDLATARASHSNELRERETTLYDTNNDGWDDLWVAIFINSHDEPKSHILRTPHLDSDGDGFTNREEMLLFRNPTTPDPLVVQKQNAEEKRAATIYQQERHREKLRRLLPLIQDGYRTKHLAGEVRVKEKPKTKQIRLLEAAKVIKEAGVLRRKKEVKSLSKEAVEALREQGGGLVSGARHGILSLVGPDTNQTAATIQVPALWPGGSSSLPNLSGSQRSIGIWEAGGGVYDFHREFSSGGVSRVTQIDDPSTEIAAAAWGTLPHEVFSFHATSVAGVIASQGILSQTQGMAYEAQLEAYGSANDFSEMLAAGVSGMELSNHSYSQRYGWIGSDIWLGPAASGEDPRFGLYGVQSKQIDVVAYESPHYLTVWSSGNEGSDLGAAPGTLYQRIHDDNGDGIFTVSGFINTPHPPDCGHPLPGATGANDLGVPLGLGFDTLKASGVAKNNLVVGAIEDLPDGYQGPLSPQIARFSSRGPTDDGRIKPDLVANGTEVVTPSFVNGNPQPVDNQSFESPFLGLNQQSGKLNGWSEDSSNSNGAAIARVNFEGLDGSNLLIIYSEDYRVWQDLSGLSKTANSTYVVTVSLGSTNGANNDLKLGIYSNGFGNLIEEKIFEPASIPPIQGDVSIFNDFSMSFTLPFPVPSGPLRLVLENLGPGPSLIDNIRISKPSNATYFSGDNAVSGTSLSTPSVTGALALLQEQNELAGGPPRLASTWKSLVINTADDPEKLPDYYGEGATLYPGPDYHYGWGVMNTLAAAELQNAELMEPSKETHLREHLLEDGQTIRIPLKVGADSEKLQVTLSWTDPPYQSVNTPSEIDEALPRVTVDNPTPVLINDLDLVIYRPEGGPPVASWKLDPLQPRSPAVRGDNEVDTVEQVTVVPLSGAFLTAGNYIAEISHKGTLRRSVQVSPSPVEYQLELGHPQAFSLSISGNQSTDEDDLIVTGIEQVISPVEIMVPLTWQSIEGLPYIIERSDDLENWTVLSGQFYGQGSSTTVTVTEPLGTKEVFYKIREVKP